MTGNRGYPAAGDTAASTAEPSTNGVYLCPAQRLNRPTERHATATGERQGRYVWMTCSCGENWWQVTR